MDIGQAVRRLKSGDRIRREAWDTDRHIDPDHDDPDPFLTYEDLLADDWEIYEDG